MRGMKIRTRSMNVRDALAVLLDGVKDLATARQILNGTQVEYTDDTEECGYPNLHIKVDGDVVRIYKFDDMETFTVSLLQRIELVWSGVPVFEPSRYGRR